VLVKIYSATSLLCLFLERRVLVSEYNPQMVRACIVAALLLLLTACSNRSTSDERGGALPPIPKLKMESYRPEIRVQVQKVYQALQANPEDPNANGNLGMLLHSFEQLESAEVCYRRARRFGPERFQWAYYLALVQALTGQNEEAATNLKDAIRIDPGYVPAEIKLAEILLGLGRLDESRRICESLLKDNPQLAPAHYWLGRIAAATGLSSPGSILPPGKAI